MSPSRGSPKSASIESHDDVAVHQQSSTALANARRNFNYLINPAKAGAGDRPGRLRTRALLRTVRYITQFIIWRLVRWAKYAAVGALVAAISATAVGGFVSGAAWIIAPPSIGASVLAASVWGVGKFAARRLHNRWRSTGGDAGEEHRERQSDSPLRREGQMGTEMGPQAIPW